MKGSMQPAGTTSCVEIYVTDDEHLYPDNASAHRSLDIRTFQSIQLWRLRNPVYRECPVPSLLPSRTQIGHASTRDATVSVLTPDRLTYHLDLFMSPSLKKSAWVREYRDTLLSAHVTEQTGTTVRRRAAGIDHWSGTPRPL